MKLVQYLLAGAMLLAAAVPAVVVTAAEADDAESWSKSVRGL